jgi:hypothetical protein
MMRTSNHVTNPWSTFGSPKDSSVSTITRSTPDAPADERPCQTHPARHRASMITDSELHSVLFDF